MQSQTPGEPLHKLGVAFTAFELQDHARRLRLNIYAKISELNSFLLPRQTETPARGQQSHSLFLVHSPICCPPSRRPHPARVFASQHHDYLQDRAPASLFVLHPLREIRLQVSQLIKRSPYPSTVSVFRSPNLADARQGFCHAVLPRCRHARCDRFHYPSLLASHPPHLPP